MKKTSLENNKKIKKIKKNNKRCEHPFESEVKIIVENDISTIDRTTFGYHTGDDAYLPEASQPALPDFIFNLAICSPCKI